MRSFDFAPLYRASIGFDQIADLLDRVSAHEGGQSSYPPYNIEKTGEDGYRISIAAAGFSEADLEIEVKEKNLKRFGEKNRKLKTKRPICTAVSPRVPVERQVSFLPTMCVRVGASYEDGMLHIELIP